MGVAGVLVLCGGCQILIGLDEGTLQDAASGEGGSGGATTAAEATAVASSSSSSGAGGGAACGLGHLVISEIRSRGINQSSDEFIELFNATDAAVTLDSKWEITERTASGSTYSVRWTGKGKSVPAFGHYLIGGKTYSQAPAADDLETSGISDASSIVLAHDGMTIDAVCYYYGMNPFNATYTCEGTPVLNPHDMTTATNSDASIARRPDGAGGDCTDSGDNVSDFIVQMPAKPASTLSPPAP